MHKLTILAAVAPLLLVARVSTQEVPVEERAYRYTRGWIHGLSSTPEAVRVRILADRPVMDFFADMLLGRRHVPFSWDSTVVMWWLAQTEREEFLPLFLAGVRKGRNSALFDPGLLGLAHHLKHPEARSALRAILGEGNIDNRVSALNALTLVNDSSAHALMREAPRQGLTSEQRQSIDQLLSRPPRDRRRMPDP